MMNNTVYITSYLESIKFNSVIIIILLVFDIILIGGLNSFFCIIHFKSCIIDMVSKTNFV